MMMMMMMMRRRYSANELSLSRWPGDGTVVVSSGFWLGVAVNLSLPKPTTLLKNQEADLEQPCSDLQPHLPPGIPTTYTVLVRGHAIAIWSKKFSKGPYQGKTPSALRTFIL